LTNQTGDIADSRSSSVAVRRHADQSRCHSVETGDIATACGGIGPSLGVIATRWVDIVDIAQPDG
jgi:hypothetical protein